MKVTIDRTEGELAVVEAEDRMYEIPLALCPGAEEGDALEITVIKKEEDPDKPDTHAIFEHLRGKKRRKSKTPAEGTE